MAENHNLHGDSYLSTETYAEKVYKDRYNSSNGVTSGSRQDAYQPYKQTDSQQQSGNARISEAFCDFPMIHSMSCWYCAEPGHSTNTCRHGKPIKCLYCGQPGHKEKHHKQYST